MLARAASLVLGGVLLATALAGCTSDGSTKPSPSPTPAVPRATFSGSAKGYVVMNLCTPGGANSIIVRFSGSPKKYAGSITATSMGFVGPDAVPYVLRPQSSSALPRVSGDGDRFTLDGVTLFDSQRPAVRITFTGTIACP